MYVIEELVLRDNKGKSLGRRIIKHDPVNDKKIIIKETGRCRQKNKEGD